MYARRGYLDGTLYKPQVENHHSSKLRNLQSDWLWTHSAAIEVLVHGSANSGDFLCSKLTKIPLSHCCDEEVDANLFFSIFSAQPIP